MKKPSRKASSKEGRAPTGAADFIAFSHEGGHPEWVIMAVEGLIEQISKLYGKEKSAKERFVDVPVCKRPKKNKAMAPFTVVVQPKASVWTVILRNLCLPLNEADFIRGKREAQMLSAKLKTRAMVFMGADTSYSMEYILYRDGKQIGTRQWESQTDRADKAFGKLGLYLPACYARGEGRGAWLAATNSSVRRIERADLLSWKSIA